MTTTTNWVGVKNQGANTTSIPVSTPVSTDIKTLKKLQKECLTIDLSKVHYGGEYYRPDVKPTFNLDPNGKEYLCVWDANSRFISHWGNLCNWNSLTPEIVKQVKEMGSKEFQEWWGEIGVLNTRNHIPNRGVWLDREFFQYSFVGGRRPREYGSNSLEMRFTNACVILDKQKKDIVYVRYDLDNDYLNEWLRERIDPNIPNNYGELHTEKEFEVLITTTTFSTEKVKVVGRSYDECLQTMKKNDPMLDVGGMGNLFSGMKTTPTREGAKPIPSSYEEWVSLQEKEVA